MPTVRRAFRCPNFSTNSRNIVLLDAHRSYQAPCRPRDPYAAQWWQANRPAAPGAIETDLKASFELLIAQPRIGTRVENARDPETRRLYLARVKYFLYYRPRGKYLEIVAFWHAARGHEPSV